MAEPDTSTDLLVVGAGPTGLTLAVQAKLMGASVRVIERHPEPRPWSPALAMHPRTLEILRGLGVADRLLRRGVIDVPLEIHFRGAVVTGRLHHLDLPETEFPFILFVPQPDVEEVLRERLEELGTVVEWGSELVEVENREDGVTSRVRTRTGIETILSRYIGGCDGPESTVRRAIGVGFPGRRYRQAIVAADITSTDLTPETAHAFSSDDGILFMFPLPSGAWRLIAPLRKTPADLSGLVTAHTAGRLQPGAVDWVTEIRPQHRLARKYRRASAFLVGDAAHVHSPAGAQGMNMGIHDAANLGWKIALAARGAPDALLDTYETERRRVARHVLRLTGVAFALEVSDAFPLRLGRRFLARPIASVLLPRPGLVSIVARVASGLDTRYRRGAIDDPAIRRRRCRPGARLPDVALADGTRLHDLIDGASFHLLDFSGSPERRDRGGGDWLRLHALTRDLLPRRGNWPGYVLVRPDGHVAACGDGAPEIDDYAATWVDGARSGRVPSELPTSS